jgi:ubiquinone/menaquinone biosynthesis C-methylase UbiE
MSAPDLSSFNRQLFDDRVFEPRETRLQKAYAMLDAEAEKGPLLDVAAGSGIVAEALQARGWVVSALEIADQQVEQIRARGIRTVVKHDLASGPLPFEDGSFRGVFAGEIIEHLVDTAGFLGEIARVLMPGGVVLITTPNLASLENRMRLLLGIYPKWVDYQLSGEGHVRGYTLPVLRRQLRAGGFELEDYKGNWVPFVPQYVTDDVRMPALSRTGDWLPRLSQGLIVKARLR